MKIRSQIRRLWPMILFWALIVLLSCSGVAQKSQVAHKGPVKITILHTNDMHGSFLPQPATWEPDKPMVGGFAALDYYVQQQKAQAGRNLLLDAGDLMTGTLICDMKYDGAYGGALVDMMNMIGYDGWVFGNHDFDKGASNLRGLMGLAKFPVFCANMVKGNLLFAKEPYHIYQFDSLKVGVIGLTYFPMAGMAAPEKLDGFDSVDPVQTVNKEVSEIDSITDLIIVLSHLGIDRDSMLAERVKGVDLIVGGHSHTRLEHPMRVNGVLIVQTGSNCRNLGRIDLTVAGDSVMAYDGKLIPMYTKGIHSNPIIAALADSFKAEIDKDYGTVIAQLNDNWVTEYRTESNIGDWFTDAMKNRMNTDVAFLNSGGIRKNLDAGPITKMDIHEILPFDNAIVTFKISGKDLIEIARKNVGLENNGTQGSLQMSGLSYVFQGDSSYLKLLEVKVDGTPVDTAKIYSVATIDYVAISNPDKYFGLEPHDIKQTDLGLTQLILDAAAQAGKIDSKIEGRIKKVSQ
jgi:5'-nucleotidase / UDP-sugar diphosphatase